MDDDNSIEMLHGRIAALEQLMTGVLMEQAARISEGDTLGAIQRMRHAIFSSLQNADRATGEYEDRVWGQMAQALDLTFRNLEQRAENLRGKG